MTCPVTCSLSAEATSGHLEPDATPSDYGKHLPPAATEAICSTCADHPDLPCCHDHPHESDDRRRLQPDMCSPPPLPSTASPPPALCVDTCTYYGMTLPHSLHFVNDGTCDDEGASFLCDPGTDCTDCSGGSRRRLVASRVRY